MNEQDARAMAVAHLETTQSMPCATIDALTHETDVAWLFTWNSRDAVESGGAHGPLKDLGPVCVRKRTRDVRTLLKADAQQAVACLPGEEAESRDGARRIVERAADLWLFSADLVVNEEHTRETRRLWVFYLQSHAFVVTKDVRFLLCGLGPFAVEKRTGRVHALGSRAPDRALAALELRLWCSCWSSR